MRFLTTPWARGRRAAAADRRRASPTVTVAVCTLDRRDQLERTLHALRSLTYPAFEVVVVNGPSSDGTAEMLEG
ncbi:MAG: glycosyltransferase, partial [Actinobacteria bacterium]|nr:glycosyltransferase [Actinomycetota bacterium]